MPMLEIGGICKMFFLLTDVRIGAYLKKINYLDPERCACKRVSTGIAESYSPQRPQAGDRKCNKCVYLICDANATRQPAFITLSQHGAKRQSIPDQ